jgi:hypothetical protein
MNTEKIWITLASLLVLALLGGAAGLVIGVAHAGTQLISSGLLLWLKVLVGLVAGLAALLAVLGSYVLGRWMVGAAMLKVAERFAELESRYGEEFNRLKAKRPAWIATLLFITEAVMILVDKSFDGHEKETLIVSFSVLIGFWVANQLMSCEERWKRLLGGALWFVVLLFIPIAAAAHRHLGPSQFFAFIWAFDPTVKIFFTVALLSLITLPTLALRIGAEGAS